MFKIEFVIMSESFVGIYFIFRIALRICRFIFIYLILKFKFIDIFLFYVILLLNIFFFRSNVYHTVSFDSVPEAMKKLPSVRVGKIVMKMD